MGTSSGNHFLSFQFFAQERCELPRQPDLYQEAGFLFIALARRSIRFR